MTRRWPFVVVALAIALGLVGWPAEAGDREAGGRSVARGRFTGEVPIGHGRELYLRCAGTGSPTVILEAGIHDSSDTWTLTRTTPPVPGSPSVFTGVSRLRAHISITEGFIV